MAKSKSKKSKKSKSSKKGKSKSQKKKAADIAPATKYAFDGAAVDQLMGADITGALDKVYGQVLHRARQTQGLKQYISTGNAELDDALGGGLLRGRVHMFYGTESSAKTHTCLCAIADVQKRCSQTGKYLDFDEFDKPPVEPLAIYVTAESDFDPDWAEGVGVDLDRLLLSFASYGERGLDVVASYIDQRAVDLIVIDSLAALAARKELEDSVSASNPGIHARMIGIGIRKILSGLTEAYEQSLEDPTVRVPTLIITNQIRFKIGVMFGNPETQSGGQAPKYAASTTTRFSKAKAKPTRSADGPQWAECKAIVKKNKTGRSGRKAEWSIRLVDTDTKNAGEVEDEDKLLKLAVKAGMVAREGNKWTVTGTDLEFKRKSDLLEEIETNPSFKHQLRKATFMVLHRTT